MEVYTKAKWCLLSAPLSAHAYFDRYHLDYIIWTITTIALCTYARVHCDAYTLYTIMETAQQLDIPIVHFDIASLFLATQQSY